jgi:hypothetical protein
LYRSNIWQEIDIEFLGANPRKIRWYVDNLLYHEETNPDHVPYLGMTLRMNHWGVCKDGSGWSGAEFATDRLDNSEAPAVEYCWIRVYKGRFDH